MLGLFLVPAAVVAVGGISHESNSFNPARTVLADFLWPQRTTREEFFARHGTANSVASGIIEGARQFGFDLFPVLLVSATPKGPLTSETFETLTAELVRQLKAAPKLDGILLDLHGAMVVESFPSGDAELVRRVRAAFPSPMPIVVTHDFHANVSPEILEHSTALLTYKENPHLDTRERGIQAARIMAGILAGKFKPTQALAKPAMLYNIVFQDTRREPLRPIVEETRRLETDPRFLAVSVSGGYQYGDVPQMGPSAVVVTDNDPALARKEADRLAGMLWATRDRLALRLPDAAAAVRDAIAAERFPVALFDMGDNIGGGSAGDSTFLLSELVKQKAQGWVVAIADPEAVAAAARAGVGGGFDRNVGGKTDRFHGEPVRIRGHVKTLTDGKYLEPETRHGGGRYHDMGLSAVIEAEGSTPELANLLLLTSRREPPYSLQQLVSCGIAPARQRILVVKGTIAPRAAYEPVAARIVAVDTGGLTAVNPARFTYRHVRRPLFGLEGEK